MKIPVLTGLDLILKSWPRRFNNARVGLLINPASVNRRLIHAIEIFFSSKKWKLIALFGPQHGLWAQTQDNMIEWEGFVDKKTGLPVYSLYGKTRKPLPEMLNGIDVFVADLQDIGSRYYTFIWTMCLCMEACEEQGKSFVVLDRPNPVNGIYIEGPVLDINYSSFVGLKPLPVRHGMTIGEIALYLKKEFYPSLDLQIIKMSGWKRRQWFDQTGLPWVMPSPNMPTLETATVYPGMCLLEGTNVSEGRGTTRPFEIFGAPFIEPERLVKRLEEFRLQGLIFRPLFFEPTFHKYTGQLCGGAQIHVTDRKRFKSFKTGIAILKALYELYPEQFRWRKPPYEYESEKLPIDILTGSHKLRSFIEAGKKLEEMEEWWQTEVKAFDKNVRKKYLLYED
ncbi:MAG: DUF1343 domain-containing protein [Thermodesulfovibrionales bacterium]|nr:DUF1343 domain-containing protein [Thermodesulfovibrionales bacterium]